HSAGETLEPNPDVKDSANFFFRPVRDPGDPVHFHVDETLAGQRAKSVSYWCTTHAKLHGKIRCVERSAGLIHAPQNATAQLSHCSIKPSHVHSFPFIIEPNVCIVGT